MNFKITIKCDEIGIIVAPKVTSTYKPPVYPIVKTNDPPRPFIQSINNVGLIKIAFTRPIMVPNYILYPEFKESGFMRPLNSTASANITKLELP